MRFVLRRMEAGDVPQVAAIDRCSFPTPWPPSAFRSELKRACGTYLVLLKQGYGAGAAGANGRHWVRRLLGVRKDRCVEGYVGFRTHEGRGHITTIALNPNWRGKGLGDYLLVEALRRMVASDVSTVTLEMRPSNEIAFRLYEKHDFRFVQLRREYYRDREDAWLMALDLSDDAYRKRLETRRQAVLSRLGARGIEVAQSPAGASQSRGRAV